MKTYERESFLKSFFVFFLLIEVLLALNYWYETRNLVRETKHYIHTDMRLCAYTLQCDGMKTDFVEEKGKELDKNILFQRKDFYAYFELPSKKYLMKVIYPIERYNILLKEKIVTLRWRWLVYSIIAAILSLLFALYTITPLRRALRLNEEFVRDILHDFNTPLSSMRVNLKLFKKEIGDDPKIARLEHNIETILALQGNLRIFLKELPTQAERFDALKTLQERIGYFKTLYPDIRFDIHGTSAWIEMNKDAFIRIVDNLLSNAGKYNKSRGSVTVDVAPKQIVICDTGVGISNPERVFERYYKEQAHGIGIGLHVVKKLCDETGVAIRIESRVNEGTCVTLDFSQVAVQ